MNVTVRRAKPEDAADVLRLLGQIAEFHHRGRPDLFKGDAAKYSETDFQAMLQDAQKPAFIAEDEHCAVVGYALCKMLSPSDNPALTGRRWLYIDDLCVDERYRGRHIGKRLYDAATAYAKEAGVYGITLNVWEFNADAMHFYESCGMKTQRRIMERIF
jgi:ribosomal protein S18 acetylase RimI-like enzyme